MRLAISTLTALPVHERWPDDGVTQVSAFYPWVGLGLGVMSFALGTLAVNFMAAQSLLPAALIVWALAGATRYLHWDGLADVGDAWHVAEERRLGVMQDSAVGAFGAVAIVFVAILQTAAVSVLIANGLAVVLLLAPLFGRLSATFGAWLGKPARSSGLGASVAGKPSAGGVAVAAVAVLLGVGVAFVLSPVVTIVSCVLGFVAALVVPHVLAGRFGGISGDVLGASVLLTETFVLVPVALVVAALVSSALPIVR